MPKMIATRALRYRGEKIQPGGEFNPSRQHANVYLAADHARYADDELPVAESENLNDNHGQDTAPVVTVNAPAERQSGRSRKRNKYKTRHLTAEE